MSTALFVIDVQRYFLKDAPENLPSGIVTHYQANNYDLIAFAVFRNRPDSNFVKSHGWDKCASDEDVIMPAEFQPYIQSNNVFERAAYSAFKNTSLDQYLKDHNVERLVLCGVDTDACVLGTCFEAFDLGYRVEIDFDLTFSSNDLQQAARKIAKQSLTESD